MTELPGTADGERTAALLRRVDVMGSALARAESQVPGPSVATVRRVLTDVRRRLELGVDHTVVALVGGTGSGKSSLFNALSGLPLAEVGARRPTTSQVSACTWGQADGLLDWFGVAADRRLERESALDGETQADLRGLVLLDLPDHDSVATEHHAVVDRLVPVADLLVWVVDPQKYADDALHTGYLRHLVGHEASMVVVLNQVDTVPPGEQATVLQDVARLLREDGLHDVPVHGVSALTGEGVPVLRAALAEAVAARRLAEARSEAELDDAGRLLAAAAGQAVEEELPREAAVVGVLEAAGAEASVEAVLRGAVGGRVQVGPVQRDRVALVRQAWVDRVTRGLPEAWQEAVAHAVASPGDLVRAVDDRLAAVHVAPARGGGARALRWAGLAVGLVALVLGGLTAGVAAGSGWTGTATAAAAVTAVAVVAAVVLLLAARRADRRAPARRAERLAEAVRTAVEAAVEEGLAAPTATVLADHRALLDAARTGRDDASTGLHVDEPPPG